MLIANLVRVLMLLLLLSLATACATEPGDGVADSGVVPVLGVLSGDLPVSALAVLPEGQRDQPIGYLSNQRQLDAVLQYLPDDDKSLPFVDFSTQLVLFVRNTVFYNRLSIGQVLRKGETLTILAMETMSARPITDKVAISLAVIKSDGARFIAGAGGRIKLNAH